MLNEWRSRVGVPPVAHDPAQTDGCRAHAQYYRLTGEQGHNENPSNPGYTSAGAKAAASSNLSYGGGAKGPYTWESAVYHRIGLLDPRLASTGFWAEHELACMGTLAIDNNRTTPTLTSYPYPYDGQIDVETEFPCLEIPNPCDNVPGKDPGFLLSVLFNGPFTFRLGGPQVALASLTPDGGLPVPLTVEDNDSGLNRSYLRGGLVLIPDEHLLEGTWYTATVSGTYAIDSNFEGEPQLVPFSASWRFRTRVVPPPFRSPNLRLDISRGRMRISSLNPSPPMVTVRKGNGERKEMVLALRPRANGVFTRVLKVRIKSVRWRVCAMQAKQFEERWGEGRACLHGAPVSLAPTILYASRNFVRLRIKAPPLARGRKAVVQLVGQNRSVLDRAIVTLRQKSRVDLSGARGSRAIAVRISVQKFFKQGIPRRVKPATIHIP